MKIILTGVTGMVGEGVLFECLSNSAVERVLIVNRRPYKGAAHPKLAELVVPDFMHLESVTDQLTGYDACFFCAGISSRGMSEVDYTHVTYDITLNFAQTLARLNPQMTFVYVSGALTDSSEKGRSMWARVKGSTENALLRLPFRAAYNFRPGFMRPTPGQQNILSYYKLIGGLYPILHAIFPRHISTLSQVARAMIVVAQDGYTKPILEVADINSLAHA